MKLPPCRLLLCVIAIVVSLLTFTGRSFADSPPRDNVQPWEYVYVVLARSEAPVPFRAPAADPARLPVVQVVFPRDFVPTGYHPQPAHC
jgi:hypothetical protein